MNAAGLLGPARQSRVFLALCGALGLSVLFVAVPAFAPNSAPLGVLLQGAELGAVNGMLAMGLILTYRANRVVNFAYGSMGGLSGSLGAMLFLGQHVNWFLSLGIGLAAGALIGVGTDLLLRWRFAQAPRLVVMVATIGLGQVFGGVQAFIPGWLNGPQLLGAFKTPLSNFGVYIRPVRFDGNDILILGVLLVVPAALTWFLRRTDAGVAVRSLAENPERARLLGIPLARLSMLVWAIAGVLAALTVMVNGPSQGVTQSVLSGPTLLLPALAAGVVARMERLTVAFGAAVAIGILNSVVAFNVTQSSITDVVLLAVIVLALLTQRHQQVGKSEEQVWSGSGVARAIPDVLRRLPEVRVARSTIGAAVVAVLVLVPVVGGPGTTLEYTIALCFGVAALSLVVLSGWSGNVSLGQFAFAGVGGVIAGDMILKSNIDLFQCLAVAAVCGAVLAVVVGLPALRVRGEFLAVTTLALAVAVNTFLLNPTNYPALIPAPFNRPLIFGRIDLSSDRSFYYFCLVVLALLALFVRGLRHARAGRVLQASRDNLRAAEAMGVPTVRVRLTAFTLAGAIAGIGGALYVITLQSAGFNTFDPDLSLLVFSMAVIGGLSSISGALIGVAVVQAATYSFPQYQDIIAGAGLLLVLLVLPGGIQEGLDRLRNVALRVVARRRGIDVPSLRGGVSDDAVGVAATGEVPAVAPRASADVAPGVRALLQCRGVETSYGPVRILFGIDLEVGRNEIVALLGTNGAGKSTLLRGISGLMDLDAGRITFEDRRLDGHTPEAIARTGVSLMPGGRGIFPMLSVDENLRLAAWRLRGDARAIESARRAMFDLFPVLQSRRSQAAGTLSGGEQQMLSLAMALTVRPQLLLIDELSLGLAPTVVGQLLDVVRQLHNEGMTIVVVEQSINVALELAERVVFMEKGEVRFAGPADALLERTDLLRAVFIEGMTPGSTPTVPTLASVESRTPPGGWAPAAAEQVVLRCDEVTKRFGGVTAANAVSLELRQGEILGLIGHNGAGKTTLMDLVSGFLPLDGGRVLLGEHDIGALTPHARAVLGLGRTFQEARLFPSLTVREILAVALERHLHSRGFAAAGLRLPASLDSEYHARRRVDEVLELMGLGDFTEKLAGELSTGTRRILELACVMAQQPRVVLLDEPSAGVAQRETEAMGPLLQRVQRETGCSLLVIEHDMPLLSAICNRLIALELGEVIATGRPAEVLAHPAVIASYLGMDDTAINRSGPAPSLVGH
ncbi:MAG TPA: ATP-binding cassette domain-containing protein [Acidimicrobiales bacterium]